MFRVTATHKTILSLAAAVSMTTPVVVLADASNPEALSWARQKPKKKAAPVRTYRAKPVARAVAPRAVPAQPVPEVLSYGPPPPPAYTPPPPPVYAPAPAYAPPPVYSAAAPLAVTAVQGTTPSLLYALLGAIIGAGVALLLDDDDNDRDITIIINPPPPVSP